MANNKPKKPKNEDQSNIGYENTETRNDGDDKEPGRAPSSEAGKDGSPKENKDDSAGLRSESGSKTLGKKAGNVKKE